MKDDEIKGARDAAYHYLLSLKVNAEDAKDFSQDAIVKIIEMDLVGTLYYKNINALAVRIAKNLFLDYKKAEKYKNRPKIFSISEYPCIKNICEEVYDDGIDKQYEEYISILNERDRNIVKMKFYGLTHTEIGEIMGISKKYSTWIFSKSLTQIKNYIKNK